MPVDIEDVHLGTAAQLLMEQGKQEAAALLLDVQSVEYINPDLLFPLDGSEGEYVKVTAKLLVEPSLLPRFTDQIQQQVWKALNQAAVSDEYYVDGVIVVPTHAAENWRESLTVALGEKPTNQARLGRPSQRWLHADRMAFRDEAEVCMYQALKRAQEAILRKMP